VITDLTGIDDGMVAAAPAPADAIRAFTAFAEGAVLVAHSHRFDMGFLDYVAEVNDGAPFARPVLDTLSLARRLHPEIPRHNLRELAAFYCTLTRPNHRALPDALATAEIFVRMLPELRDAGLVLAEDAARYCGIADSGLLARKLALATEIPDGPGIYLFRDDEGRVIYVGRAQALRTRIRTHFYAAAQSTSCTPATAVTSIQYVDTVSPLDAALLEVRLKDRYAPPFNDDRLRLRTPLFLHLDTDADYPTLRLTRRRLRSGVTLGPLSSAWGTETFMRPITEQYGLTGHRNEPAAGRAPREPKEPDAAGSGAREALRYRQRVLEALAVLNGGGPALRSLLAERRAAELEAGRLDEAVRFRDALRALDRTLSALALAERSARDPVIVLIEGDGERIAVHVIVYGWRFTTLRFTRAEVATGAHTRPVLRSLVRARRKSRTLPPVTPQRLRDTQIIDAYRRQHAPIAIVVGTDASRPTDVVATAIRRLMRVPRKHHGAVSAG
jgi:DNA polymerase-3 subunit epsilon